MDAVQDPTCNGCNPLHGSMHPLYGALPALPYVPVWVTRGAAHRFTYAPPRCRISQYSRTLIPFSVSLWNDLSDPVLDGAGQAGFKSRANAFFFGLAACSPFVSSCFPFLFFHSMCWYCGAGVFGLIGC